MCSEFLEELHNNNIDVLTSPRLVIPYGILWNYPYPCLVTKVWAQLSWHAEFFLMLLEDFAPLQTV